MLVFRGFAGGAAFDTVANWSFGSIGFPTNLCSKAPLDWSSTTGNIEMVFECKAHTQISEVFSSGVVSYNSATDYNGLVEVFGKCYYDPEAPDA